MGMWSKIGKFASIAAPIAATVMTGGAAAPLLATGGSGVFSKIMGAVGKNAGALGSIGSGIGAMTESAAKNRGAAGEIAFGVEDRNQGRERLRQGDDSNAIGANNSNISAGQLNRQSANDLQQQLVAREQEGRIGRRSAMQDLQVANYVGNRSAAGPTVTTSGKTLNTMGLGPRASTDQEKQGMAAAAKEIMARLEGGNPIAMPTAQPTAATDFQVPSAGAPRMWEQPFAMDPKVTQQSTWEKIGNVLGPAMSMLGAPGIATKKPVPYSTDDVYRPEQ